MWGTYMCAVVCVSVVRGVVCVYTVWHCYVWGVCVVWYVYACNVCVCVCL